MKRRTFIKGLTSLVAAGAVTGYYTWQIEPFRLEFVRKKMRINNLPKHLVGTKLMQISDIHVGNDFDWNFIIESFQKAKAFKPEFVVYTGDYVSYRNKEQCQQLRTVMKHAVIGSIGTAGVLGNHDFGHRWRQPKVANAISAIMEQAGVKMLRNEKKSFKGLNIIGFDDLLSTTFYPQKVMNTYNPDQANLVLCHNPDACDRKIWNGYKGWILSGHTHGGQCKPPFLSPPILPVKNRRYSAGEIDLKDGRMLYINRALGHSLQVRFNVRPEITIFELA